MPFVSFVGFFEVCMFISSFVVLRRIRIADDDFLASRFLLLVSLLSPGTLPDFACEVR